MYARYCSDPFVNTHLNPFNSLWDTHYYRVHLTEENESTEAEWLSDFPSSPSQQVGEPRLHARQAGSRGHTFHHYAPHLLAVTKIRVCL